MELQVCSGPHKPMTQPDWNDVDEPVKFVVQKILRDGDKQDKYLYCCEDCGTLYLDDSNRW